MSAPAIAPAIEKRMSSVLRKMRVETRVGAVREYLRAAGRAHGGLLPGQPGSSRPAAAPARAPVASVCAQKGGLPRRRAGQPGGGEEAQR